MEAAQQEFWASLAVMVWDDEHEELVGEDAGPAASAAGGDRRARKRTTEEVIRTRCDAAVEAEGLGADEQRLLRALGTVVSASNQKLEKKLTVLDSNFRLVNAKVDCNRDTVLRRIEALGAEKREADSHSGSTLSGDLASASSDNYAPMKLRRTLCVGGLRYDEGQGHVAVLTEDFKRFEIGDVDKIYLCDAFTDRCMVHFSNSQAMWAALTKMKGKHFPVAGRVAEGRDWA